MVGRPNIPGIIWGIGMKVILLILGYLRRRLSSLKKRVIKLESNFKFWIMSKLGRHGINMEIYL